MSLWIHEVLKELVKISPEQEESTQPVTKLEIGDHIVGRLDENHADLRKLYVLMDQYHRRAHEMISILRLQTGKQDVEQTSEITRTLAMQDALECIFWVSVRSSFPDLWGKDQVCIRADWQIVWVEEEEIRSIPLSISIDASEKTPSTGRWN